MSAGLYVVEYNGTIDTGGDSLTEDLNIFYEVSNTTNQLHPRRIEELTQCRVVTSLGS